MSAPRPDRSLPEPQTAADTRGAQPASAPPLDRQARALIARIRKNWNDVEAIRALADHYRSANDYPSLANLMEGWGDALEDPRGAADAYVEAADALLMSARPGDEARLLYERALSRDPSHVQALDRLSRVLEENKNHDRLKQVLKYVAHQLQQQQPAGGGSRQLLASVHYRLGQVYETYFGEPRKAATLYRQAIEENPRLITAIAAARRLYLEQGNHKTVSVLFEFEIEATPNADDKQALLLALARHKRELCDDLDGAVLAFRRAAKLAPGSVRALFGLAETLLARSERVSELAAGADRQRAGEVFFHLAQRVPPSDALPYLQRALLVVPNHTQARAMWESAQRAKGSPASRPPAPRAANGGGVDAGAQQRAEAEAWLRDSDLRADDVTSAELLPVDDEPLTSPLLSVQPPPELVVPAPPRPRPPAPPVVTRPAPPPAAPPHAAPQHPKVINVLGDDPARVSLEVNVGSTTDSNFYVDMSDQLLDGGVFVATYTPLPIDALTMLTITLPGKLVARAHGRVVLTRDLMDAFDDHTPGMCVAFEAVDPKSLALIERFVRKRAPMFVEL